MKRSKTITLVILTSAFILSCGEEDVRNRYASWDDCVADYKDPKKCTAEQQSAPQGTRFFYYGPWYRPSQSSNTAYNPSHFSGRSTGVSRGGFGSFGRSSS